MRNSLCWPEFSPQIVGIFWFVLVYAQNRIDNLFISHFLGSLRKQITVTTNVSVHIPSVRSVPPVPEVPLVVKVSKSSRRVQISVGKKFRRYI